MKPRLIAALLLIATSAHAVILYRSGDPNENTTAPAGADANSGWQYEGDWGGFLGTPFAPHHFLSAAHIGDAGNSILVYQSVTYHVIDSTYDAQSDLVIWKVAEEFPTFAPLYARTDEVGRRVIAIGRGTQRGAPLFLSAALKGWDWGAGDAVRRWGENTFSGVVPFGANNDLLFANFDQAGLPNECHLSVGDSGGAAFVNDGSAWKLAGIHYSVDGYFYTNAMGDGEFIAALFDARGYHNQDGDNYPLIEGAAAVPTAFYSTRISTRLPWICRTIAEPRGGRDGNIATITYTRLIFPASDLAYTVQQSTDLVSWSAASATEEVLSTSGSSQVVKAKVTLPTGDGGFFLRLQIARP